MIERDDLDTIRYFFLTTGSVCLTDWTPDLKTTFTLSTKNGEYFVDFDKVVRDLTDPKKEGTAEYRIAEKFLSTICTLIPESHSVLSCSEVLPRNGKY